MTEGSDNYGFKIDANGLNRETYRTVATNPGPPRRRSIDHSEMLLHAVRTSRRFGN